MMRTSTGSISVTKMAQKNRFFIGNRKYTMAKADSSEMAILPKVMTSAETRLTHSIRAAGAVEPAPPPPPKRADLYVSTRLPPGHSGMGTCVMSWAVWVEAMNARYSGKATITRPSTITRWVMTRSPKLRSTMMGSRHQYCTFFSI